MSDQSEVSETSSSTERARLLERQRAILYYLATPTAYESKRAPNPEAPWGIDIERLKILGRLILGKRFSKIEALLPATCRCVKMHAPALIREFAIACLPTSTSRRDAAREFHDFIVTDYKDLLQAPNYLVDLVRLEYLVVSAAFAARDRALARQAASLDPTWTAFEVRVRPNLQVFETEFDLHSALGDSSPAALERGRPRMVAIVPGETDARVFWLEEEIATLLLDIGEWTPVCAQDRESVHRVIEALVAQGLVEIRPCDFA